MLSAIVTLMVDSIATSIYSRKCGNGVTPESGVAAAEAAAANPHEMAVVNMGQMTFHGHGHHHDPKPAEGAVQQLLRYRVIAMVKKISAF